jgi:hypothetical protein
MYTQLLKDIILTLDFNRGHFQEFLTYCCEKLIADVSRHNLDKFEKEYRCEKAI